MAKKKEDLDFEYEDDEVAEDDEYGEEDADEDADDEFDEEEDEDGEEGGKKGGGALKVAVLAVLFLGAVGAGAFAFMSSGGSLDFLSGVPVVGQYFAKPTPPPIALPSGFVNPNLETRKPASLPAVPGAPAAPAAGATAAVAAKPAIPGEAAQPAAKPAAPAAPAAVAVKPAAPVAQPVAPPAEEPPPVIEQPLEQPTVVAAKPEPKKAKVKKAKRERAAIARKRHEGRRHAYQVAEGGTGRGGYSVQVGSFSQPANAERLISTLKSQGYPAFGTGTGRVSYGQTGGQFQVRSNVVDSRQKATQLANQFRLAGWSPRVLPLSGGQYALHLGTFGTQEQANALVADLNAKGLFATVSGRVGSHAGSRVGSVTVASAGGPNRVWVGSFNNRAEAEAMASKLRSSVGAAIVVRR